MGSIPVGNRIVINTMKEANMDVIERAMLQNMINHETFYGLPIDLVDPEMIEQMTQEQLRIFWVVANMLQSTNIDKLVEHQYPFEAEYYLSKFTINPT
jgi:hypothetical protein